MYLNNNWNICLIIFGIFIIDMDSSFFVMFLFVYFILEWILKNHIIL